MSARGSRNLRGNRNSWDVGEPEPPVGNNFGVQV